MFTLYFMAMHTHKMTLCNKQTRKKTSLAQKNIALPHSHSLFMQFYDHKNYRQMEICFGSPSNFSVKLVTITKYYEQNEVRVKSKDGLRVWGWRENKTQWRINSDTLKSSQLVRNMNWLCDNIEFINILDCIKNNTNNERNKIKEAQSSSFIYNRNIKLNRCSW